MSRGVPGRCVWHYFLLALGHHAMLPAGCGWSWHRSPALKGLSELPLSQGWHGGQYSTHGHACRGGLTRIPTPSPSGCCPRRCSRPVWLSWPFRVGCCWPSCATSVGPTALPYSTAGPPAAAPTSAAVTLCFAASQHPSLSSPICLTLLGPPFYKMGRKTVSSCLCSVLL